MADQKPPSTLAELGQLRRDLEDGACLSLGRLVMAFSRIDMELGLAVVWAGFGADLDARTARFEVSTFHSKLAELERKAAQRYKGGEAAASYTEWVGRAHALRGIRNELMHGRWGTSPATGTVVNVLGLPTSSGQREVHYTLGQLEALVAEITVLRDGLRVLREKFPI